MEHVYTRVSECLSLSVHVRSRARVRACLVCACVQGLLQTACMRHLQARARTRYTLIMRESLHLYAIHILREGEREREREIHTKYTHLVFICIACSLCVFLCVCVCACVCDLKCM